MGASERDKEEERKRTSVNGFIPMDKCEDRGVYRIKSRNLAVGVYRAEVKGFVGIRLKFNSYFLFTEFHHDTGAPCGTVEPLEKLDVKLPDDVSLDETIGSVDQTTGKPVEFKGRKDQGGKGWCFVGTDEPVKGMPQAIENKALFEFLEGVERGLGDSGNSAG